MTWQNWTVAGVAALFALWILARMATPARGVPRRPVPGLREALRKVQDETTPKAKGAALIAAGDLLAADGAHLTSATAYYLRAMRLDPASPEPLARLEVVLRARPRALERILWKRLAILPWEGETRIVVARAAELLAGRTTRKRIERQVFAKLASSLR